jgi:hypothetical protein
MNQTDAYTNYSTPATRSEAHDHESLLSKIVAGLKTISMSRRLKVQARFQHQSFMDANLLDDVMGPEISRTLRR